MNISTHIQTNENIENLKKNYYWYKQPNEKNKWKLKPTMDNSK